ncbi:MAG TPA: TonB-dependent receptor, partial [Chitinophagaceae bacterium]|nr:TonB-dependent receptor [Chitinophagaceae bacterium]
MNRCFLLLLVFVMCSTFCNAQRKAAIISGYIVGENEEAISQASVTLLGWERGTTTNDSGFFTITVAADKAVALLFSYTGYKTRQQNFLLAEGENEKVTIRLERSGATLKEVIIADNRQRTEAGLIRPNPKSVINLPSPVSGVESLIKVFVGSNNELTSQYNVRGGSYDENLIYVNDFEIFRPYLIRSGQQEGLSFINPELVRNISFYNGGFPVRYGDKMSSVLDIQYNKPRAFGGSAYVGLLEQGLRLEGLKKKFTYLVGARNRSNQSLLRSQPIEGTYLPSSSDLQVLFTYQVSHKWSAELLSNLSTTKFSFIPRTSQLTTAVLSPYSTKKLNAAIAFNGQEKDAYTTAMTGIAATYELQKNLRL